MGQEYSGARNRVTRSVDVFLLSAVAASGIAFKATPENGVMSMAAMGAAMSPAIVAGLMEWMDSYDVQSPFFAEGIAAGAFGVLAAIKVGSDTKDPLKAGAAGFGAAAFGFGVLTIGRVLGVAAD